MKRLIFIVAFLVLYNIVSFSQDYYWQQKVFYCMDIYLDVQKNILHGRQNIIYYNNSPDTLKEIYFHLYWNAFKKGSYMHRKSISTARYTAPLIEALKPEEEGNVEIKSIKIKNKLLKWEEHDTVLKLLLESPVIPNSNIELEVEFQSQVPLLVRRAGRDNSQDIRYSMAQWYPKIAEYDFEGWHNNEYAGREFYGIYGNFDVKITLDPNYIIAASGVIQNPEEVKCGYELGKIDTTLMPEKTYETKEKTWHFVANNVHDFAWAADTGFIHDITYWNDVTIHSLHKVSYHDRWANVKNYAKNMLSFYSERYGLYPYKSFTVVQAGDGGMEYPTILFNLGYSPGLMAHEGGHQWFYGILGNNESREAWLDEGIITYLTMETLYEGFKSPRSGKPDNSLAGLFILPFDEHFDYKSYWITTRLGIEEPLNTPSDHFKNDVAYTGGPYQKGGLIFPMLEYVMGKELFDSFMKRYFNEWKFKHPHTEDIKRVAEKESGMKLDWFFDQWVKTTKTCDYAVKSLSGKWIKDEESGTKKYEIICQLENKDDIIMPIDLEVKFKSGKKQMLNIPVDWVAKNEPGLIVLPRWDWVDKKYSFRYKFDEEVKSVSIDPSLRMKDLNRLNNNSGFLPPFDIHFIRPIFLNPPIDKYWVTIAPSIWYSEPDGMRLGIREIGGYMSSIYENKIYLSYLTKSNQMDYNFSISLPFDQLGKMSNITMKFSKMYGVKNISASIEHTFLPFYPDKGIKKSLSFYYDYSQLVENDLPYHNIVWERVATKKAGAKYTYSTKLDHKISFSISGDLTLASNSYTQIKAEYLQSFKFLPIAIRAFGGYSSHLPVLQDQFYLSSASPSEQINDPIFRSIYLLNGKLSKNVNLNLAGYGNITSLLEHLNSGKNIVAFSIESHPFFNSILNVFLYSNIANLWNSEYNNFSDFIKGTFIEGGLALSVDLNSFRSIIIPALLHTLPGTTIRLNIPFLLNKVNNGEHYLDWRWNISIGKVINL